MKPLRQMINDMQLSGLIKYTPQETLDTVRLGDPSLFLMNYSIMHRTNIALMDDQTGKNLHRSRGVGAITFLG